MLFLHCFKRKLETKKNQAMKKLFKLGVMALAMFMFVACGSTKTTEEAPAEEPQVEAVEETPAPEVTEEAPVQEAPATPEKK